MSCDGVVPLITVEGSVTGKKYRQILQEHFLPLFANRRRRPLDTILQNDNAPVHRANMVTSWKTKNNLTSFKWPAQSPDLNVVEHLWMVLKKVISTRNPPPRTVADLQVVVREEWGKIQKNTVRTLVESMPKRAEKVIKTKGFGTKYWQIPQHLVNIIWYISCLWNLCEILLTNH